MVKQMVRKMQGSMIKERLRSDVQRQDEVRD